MRLCKRCAACSCNVVIPTCTDGISYIVPCAVSLEYVFGCQPLCISICGMSVPLFRVYPMYLPSVVAPRACHVYQLWFNCAIMMQSIK